MIKVLVNGCNGRMGQEVVAQIKRTDDFITVAGFDKEINYTSTFPIYNNIDNINELVDVIIDFSMPEATLKILEYASTRNIPVVIATTGFSDDQMEKVKTFSNIIPIFKSANMSYEVNVMSKMCAIVSKLLSDSDIEIIEEHHSNKVDAPSGTALLLADSINDALNNELYYEYNRHSKREKRNKKEIGMHSIRGGTTVGKHTVMFFGDNESFEITHNVSSRSVFAKGAVKAAEFITTKKPGLYSMDDLIQI
ncbi:MAG: 4-hydroxy-tetrahydrodipicolinate reductase [Lachnospiraceae bacterium]|jgi:4-hydroxy-tetrahydrodipicolinate reductase|nr:4-hydroxy-tetrahydrodipicolinate reductase [Lachnospiraceae bacterium]